MRGCGAWNSVVAVWGVVKKAADGLCTQIYLDRTGPQTPRLPSTKAQKGAKGYAGSRGHAIVRTFLTKIWANVMKEHLAKEIAKVGEAETGKSSREDRMVGKKRWTM